MGLEFNTLKVVSSSVLLFLTVFACLHEHALHNDLPTFH